MKKILFPVIVLLFVFAAVSYAEVETKFYGQQWLRYEYKFVGPNPASNSFYVPRTYLRFSAKDFDMGYETFITADINNDQYAQKVTSSASSGIVDWGVYLKFGYVQLNKLPLLSDFGVNMQAGVIPVNFGIVGPWQYPLIEKALEDRRGYVGSADQGIALNGVFPEGFGSYTLAVFNGAGFKKMEDNMEKAYMATLQVSPIKEVYGRVSYYRTLTNLFNAAAARYDVTSAVLGFKIAEFEGFVEYIVKNSAKDAVAGKSGTGEGYSIFANYDVLPFLGLLLRCDIMDPDTFTRKDETNTYIAGLNIKLAKDVMILQLNYQLDAAKFRGTDTENVNLYSAQVKWSW
jgi:hypothetical protein